MKSRPISTADKLLSFRERLSRHYAAVRNPKMKAVPRPMVREFDGINRTFAICIEGEEPAKHNAQVAADESFKKLGYKS